MTDSNVTRLPQPGVVLNLDTEERDPKDVKPPFVVLVGGREIEFSDPTELDWRDLASLDAPGDLIHVALSKEDRRHLSSVKLPGWKFNRLMESYYTHYDLEDKIHKKKVQDIGGQIVLEGPVVVARCPDGSAPAADLVVRIADGAQRAFSLLS